MFEAGSFPVNEDQFLYVCNWNYNWENSNFYGPKHEQISHAGWKKVTPIPDQMQAYLLANQNTDAGEGRGPWDRKQPSS